MQSPNKSEYSTPCKHMQANREVLQEQRVKQVSYLSRYFLLAHFFQSLECQQGQNCQGSDIWLCILDVSFISIFVALILLGKFSQKVLFQTPPSIRTIYKIGILNSQSSSHSNFFSAGPCLQSKNIRITLLWLQCNIKNSVSGMISSTQKTNFLFEFQKKEKKTKPFSVFSFSIFFLLIGFYLPSLSFIFVVFISNRKETRRKRKKKS